MGDLAGFTLIEPLGEGGMADVWKARDEAGHQYAIKLLRAGFDPKMLRREVQVTAWLNHPGVIRVEQWGEVTASDAQSTGFDCGTPWFAMELAMSTLDPGSVTTWAGFRALTMQVLDALMHAHSRGVVHRDIKPPNILVMGDAEIPRYVLSDFGIAFPTTSLHQGTREVDHVAAGTAHYMAPEQLLGRWRDFAAHTDLFSLGVVLFQIVYGALPFPGRTRVEIALVHQRGALKLTEGQFDTPGLDEWLRSLLSIDQRQRFAFAADAAHAFSELHERSSPVEVAWQASVEWGTTLPLGWTTEVSESSDVGAMSAALHLGVARAPVVRDWRSRFEGSGSAAGVRLFGLRRAGIVGREPERDAMWAALVGMIEHRTASAIVVRGPDGAGGARVARWLGERATEVGMAAIVRVHRRSTASALVDTIVHALGLGGLDRNARERRLAELFPEADIDLGLLLDLLDGAGLSMSDVVFAVRQLLNVVASTRPIVVTVADAHEDLELLEVAMSLVGEDLPVLFVLHARDEAVSSSPYCAERLDDLAKTAGCLSLSLTPLDEETSRAFVNTVERMPEGDVASVVQRSGGNPLHALQLIELWTSAGIVAEGNLETVWIARVSDALELHDWPALLAAAVLDDGFRYERWLGLCERVGITIPDGMVDRLLDARLWDVDANAYRFEHRSLRRALLGMAQHATLIRDVERHAASLWSRQSAGGQLRYAAHMLRADEPDQAAAAAFDAVNLLIFEGRPTQAAAAAQWMRSHLRDLGARQAQLWVKLVDAASAHQSHDFEAARVLAHEIAASPDASPVITAEALRMSSLASDYLGESDRAYETAQQAVAHAENGGDGVVLSRVRSRIARCLLRRGELKLAVSWLELATETDGARARLQALTGLAHAYSDLWDFNAAEEVLLRCVSEAQALGARVQLGHTLSALATVEQRRGNLAAADRHLAEALRLLRRTYPEYVSQLLTNRAGLNVYQGNAEQAQMLLTAARDHTEPDSYTSGYIRLLEMAVMALAGDVGRWRESIETLGEDRFPATTMVECWIAAGQAWHDHGERQLATQALEAAERAMERTDSPPAELLDKLQQLRTHVMSESNA